MIAKPVYSSKQQRAAWLRACKKSLYFLGKHVLDFKDAMDEPHARMCAFSEDPAEKRKFIIGARGIYKTSFLTQAKAVQTILRTNGECTILIVSNTDKNAEAIVGAVLDEFKRNEKLRQLVPHLIPARTQSVPWSKGAFTLNRRTRDKEPTVKAAGVGQQLASTHFTTILFDDPVAVSQHDMKPGDIIVLREEDVQKAIGTFKLAVEGLSINRPGFETEIQCIVNRWGVFDFAQYMLDNHIKSEDNPNGFALLKLAAHDDEGNLLWPEGLGDEKLDRIRQFEGDFTYYTQYECKPYSPLDRKFDPDLNAWWDGQRPPGFSDMRIYCLVDTADKKKRASCHTAVVVAAVDTNNHIWVLDEERQKVDPDGKMDMIHRMVTRWDLGYVYIEENLHDDLLQYVLREGMLQRGRKYVVRPLHHHNVDKDTRIMRLTTHHNRGALHIKRTQGDLLAEMRDFPFSHQKDTLDALAYIMDFVPAVPRRPAEPRAAADLNGKITFTIAEIKQDIDRQRIEQYAGAGLFAAQRTPAGQNDYANPRVAI